MGIKVFYNVHANKWEVRFRGEIWQFDTALQAEGKVFELKNKYLR